MGPCITGQHHNDLLSAMCMKEITGLRECMDELLALILEWHLCLSNATNFCDKQSFSCADTNAFSPVGFKSV